jgi:DNA-directed RNA polymerase II subunit RPB1
MTDYGYNPKKANLPISEIIGVTFSLIGDKDIKESSCVSIGNVRGTSRQQKVDGGINDIRLGTIHQGLPCGTCFHYKANCIGHPGDLKLRYPLPNVMELNWITWWLNAICWHCGRFRAQPKKTLVSKHALDDIHSQSVNVVICPWSSCRAQQWKAQRGVEFSLEYTATPIRPKRTSNKFVTENGPSEPRVLYYHVIHEILHKIADSTALSIGISLESHPRKLVNWYIEVPSTTIRPEMTIHGKNKTASNDLTSMLGGIIDANLRLPAEIPEEISSLTRREYNDFVSLYDGYINGTTQSKAHKVQVIAGSGRVLESAKARLKSKQGMLRQNAFGKRTRFNARCVIVGDPELRIDEVGVPLSIAMSQTICETVTVDNIDQLSIYYNNGPTKYPGCPYVEKKDIGCFGVAKLHAQNYAIKIGDIIYRHLIDGDPVSFGRQPSLYPTSLCGHRIKVFRGLKVFTINPSVCPFYNADFDGDCMLMIFYTNPGAIIECKYVSYIGNLIIDMQNSIPLTGAYQDSLVMAALMTLNQYPKIDPWYAKQMFCKILSLGPGNKLASWSFDKSTHPRELLSKIIPGINLHGFKPTIYQEPYEPFIEYDPLDTKVLIENGQIKSGVIDANTIGKGAKNGIIHTIFIEHGPEVAIETIANIHKLSSQFLPYDGFTMKLSDVMVTNKEDFDDTQKLKQILLGRAQELIDDLKEGRLKPPLNMNMETYFERLMIDKLQPLKEFSGPILRNCDFYNNGFQVLMNIGSKGKPTNLTSLAVTIGQAFVGNNRPGFTAGWFRCSPYGQRFSLQPVDHGYIQQAYTQGIAPESTCHASAETRHSLIQNALKTAETGTANRESIIALATILLDYYLHCTKENGTLVQSLYGENGIDPRYTETVKLNTIMMSDAEFEKAYKNNVNKADKANGDEKIPQNLYDDEFAALTLDREKHRQTAVNIEKFEAATFRPFSASIASAVNVERVIINVLKDIASDNVNDSFEDEYDPVKAVEMVNAAISALPDYISYGSTKAADNRKLPHLLAAVEPLGFIIRAELCTRKLEERGIKNKTLQRILDAIGYTYVNALMEPGRAVGVLAAQCYCAPLTQFMLDSKHRVGAGTSSKTSPIIRLDEIIKAVKEISNPRMFIFLKPEYNNPAFIREFSNKIEMAIINDYIKTASILYNSFGNIVHPDYKTDNEFISNVLKKNPMNQPPNSLTPWCIRLEFNYPLMMMKNITLESIILCLKKYFKYTGYIINTSEHAKDIVIWIFLLEEFFIKKQKKSDKQRVINLLENEILQLYIRGINGIKSAEIRKRPETYIDEDGTIKQREQAEFIITDGTNLEAILAFEEVDASRTRSDSILELEQIYGIEVARAAIISEMEAIMPNVISTHPQLYASEMCQTGRVTAVQKNGVRERDRDNIAQRVALGNPMASLSDAVIHNLTDPASGVSGALLWGKIPHIGTRYHKLAIDEDMIESLEENMDEEIDNIWE